MKTQKTKPTAKKVSEKKVAAKPKKKVAPSRKQPTKKKVATRSSRKPVAKKVQKKSSVKTRSFAMSKAVLFQNVQFDLRAFFRLIAAVLMCELAGVIGGFFAANALTGWYGQLNQPAVTPPNWVFSPVWNLLYVLMGLSLFLIWQNGLRHAKVRSAVRLFWIHLLVNAAWSVVFFGLQNIGLALIFILAMWLMIAYLMIAFSRINKIAAWLLIPYLAWVSFAVVLNYGFFVLN